MPKLTRPRDAADPLAELQLQVARRADELVRASGVRTALNLRCWLQAEEEILGSWRAPIPPGDEARHADPSVAAEDDSG